LVASFALTTLLASASQATDRVSAGYDPCTTRQGTAYDFNGAFGNGNVILPQTDTIIQRLQDAELASPSDSYRHRHHRAPVPERQPPRYRVGPEYIFIDLDSHIRSRHPRR
jgi:hypothetical protein